MAGTNFWICKSASLSRGNYSSPLPESLRENPLKREGFFRYYLSRPFTTDSFRGSHKENITHSGFVMGRISETDSHIEKGIAKLIAITPGVHTTKINNMYFIINIIIRPEGDPFGIIREEQALFGVTTKIRCFPVSSEGFFKIINLLVRIRNGSFSKIGNRIPFFKKCPIKIYIRI